MKFLLSARHANHGRQPALSVLQSRASSHVNGVDLHSAAAAGAAWVAANKADCSPWKTLTGFRVNDAAQPLRSGSPGTSTSIEFSDINVRIDDCDGVLVDMLAKGDGEADLAKLQAKTRSSSFLVPELEITQSSSALFHTGKFDVVCGAANTSQPFPDVTVHLPSGEVMPISFRRQFKDCGDIQKAFEEKMPDLRNPMRHLVSSSLSTPQSKDPKTHVSAERPGKLIIGYIYAEDPENVVGSMEIKAPMVGKIVKIGKKHGEEVQKGDVLFVMEAMKMESVIRSPSDGTVGSVGVRVGDSATHDQVLMTLME